MMSAFELADLRQCFARLDADGNGRLTIEEIKAGAMELGLLKVLDVEALFQKIDVDGSGEIDFTEFVDGCAEFAAQSLRTTFARLDADGNGELTLEEMKAGVHVLGIGEHEVEGLFRRMDSDGSGAIDYGEFAAKLLSEMSGAPAGLGPREHGRQDSRFHALRARALQVHVVSLEGLPHRQDAGASGHAKKETFAVRLRWPSAPFFGHSELAGLEAYVWGTPRRRRPKHSHGAYVSVDHTLRLPWVNGETTAIFSVYETDLLKERLFGEVHLHLEGLQDTRLQRFRIRGPDGSAEGHANLRVTVPSKRHRFWAVGQVDDDGAGATVPRPIPPRRRKSPLPWWSPLRLCSLSGPSFSETC